MENETIEKKLKLKEKLTNQRYTTNIDQVFKLAREEAEGHLLRLGASIEKEPGRYDNEFSNLKSYIDDLEELQLKKKARKSFALE